MAITVDIADRLYDYSDEEKALGAIEDFQAAAGLDDVAIITIWEDEADPRRSELERRIIDAIDANGSAKRAQEQIPTGITLSLEI